MPVVAVGTRREPGESFRGKERESEKEKGWG
jgi:hypothetical protein